MNAPQIVDLEFRGVRHWFEVWRFDTQPDLFAALAKDNIRDFPKDTVAYCDNYGFKKDGNIEYIDPECGRMYFLDKSIDSLAHEAAHMALGILARSGHKQMEVTAGKAPDIEEDLAQLIGEITSQLYSQQRFY